MKDNMRTYQTRIHGIEEVLKEYAKVYSQMEHLLFKAMILGMDMNTCKVTFLSAFDVTARQFNACKAILDGKIASIQEKRDLQITELQDKIKTLSEKITRIKNPFIIHQKKRRLEQLKYKLASLKEDKEQGTIRLCFGSKKLFNAQFALEKNGFATHEEWKNEWEETRHSEFFVLGSKDEAGGNQTCTASIAEDGSLTLRLRLPGCLEEKYGKYAIIPNVRFEYGHKEVLNALLECEKRRDLKDTSLGQAISYRFKQDKKGWRIFASVSLPNVALTTNAKLGVIGVDINNNHLALVETDRFGNPIHKKTIPLSLYGKTSDQSKAIIGDACKSIAQFAKKAQKPIVLEDLNFQKKKNSLKEQNSSYARMLSSFAYKAILMHIKSGSSKLGIEVKMVNPAYTSVIGRVKFSKRYGLSIHQAAALCIARRSLRFSEKPPSCLTGVPDGKNGQVALSLPVRNRGEHVWSFWKKVTQKLSVVLAAHFRSMKNQSTSALKAACKTPKAPEVIGEIPIHESSEPLLC